MSFMPPRGETRAARCASAASGATRSTAPVPARNVRRSINGSSRRQSVSPARWDAERGATGSSRTRSPPSRLGGSLAEWSRCHQSDAGEPQSLGGGGRHTDDADKSRRSGLTVSGEGGADVRARPAIALEIRHIQSVLSWHEECPLTNRKWSDPREKGGSGTDGSIEHAQRHGRLRP